MVSGPDYYLQKFRRSLILGFGDFHNCDIKTQRWVLSSPSLSRLGDGDGFAGGFDSSLSAHELHESLRRHPASPEPQVFIARNVEQSALVKCGFESEESSGVARINRVGCPGNLENFADALFAKVRLENEPDLGIR